MIRSPRIQPQPQRDGQRWVGIYVLHIELNNIGSNRVMVQFEIDDEDEIELQLDIEIEVQLAIEIEDEITKLNFE